MLQFGAKFLNIFYIAGLRKLILVDGTNIANTPTAVSNPTLNEVGTITLGGET
jgi:hypothetical protein